MAARILRWSLNILAVIAVLLLIFIPVNKENPNKVWIPYMIFAIANWLFADMIFRYIPTHIKIIRNKINVHLLFDFILSLAITIIVFKLSARYLFDDAGYVLRYVENFQHGYFYQFNASDSPVFGLSGFIYGLLCFFISIFGFSSPVSVKLACLFGSVGYLFVLLQLCRCLIADKRLIWIAFILVGIGLETIVLMFPSGLELPVHITIVVSAIYFYHKSYHRTFLLFAALSIISKLDATPIMAVLLGLYAWEHIFLPQNTKEIKTLVLYFILPLGVWLLFTFVFFGSPLPQSAFAKLNYHPNTDKNAFPFFHYFLQHPVRKITIIAFEVAAVLHLIEILFYRKLKYVKPFVFGYMLVGIMALYYYYNPNERMIWYYSLPEFLLTIQVIYSFIYFTSKKSLAKLTILTIVPLLVFMLPVFKNLLNAKEYHAFYSERVERERYMIGNFMHDISSKTDTLMSSHGLVGWNFKGYVMDLSGLNSKLVTQFKRKPDSLLSVYKPHYIINHAWTHDLNIYGKYGYEIDTAFADITLLDYPFWAIMKRTNDKKRGYARLPLQYCINLYDGSEQSQVTRFFSDSLSIEINKIEGYPVKLWTGIKREEVSFSIEIVLYNENEVMNKQLVYIEKGAEHYVSKYVKGVCIPFEHKGIKATSVSIIPRGIYSFACLGPVLEYVYE